MKLILPCGNKPSTVCCYEHCNIQTPFFCEQVCCHKNRQLHNHAGGRSICSAQRNYKHFQTRIISIKEQLDNLLVQIKNSSTKQNQYQISSLGQDLKKIWESENVMTLTGSQCSIIYFQMGTFNELSQQIFQKLKNRRFIESKVNLKLNMLQEIPFEIEMNAFIQVDKYLKKAISSYQNNTRKYYKFLRMASQYNHFHPKVLFGLGYWQQIQCRKNQSLAYYKNALEFGIDQKTKSLCYYNISLLYSCMKKFDQSVLYIEKAIEINKYMRLFYYHYAQILHKQGKFYESIQEIKKVILETKEYKEEYKVKDLIRPREQLIQELIQQCEQMINQYFEHGAFKWQVFHFNNYYSSTFGGNVIFLNDDFIVN